MASMSSSSFFNDDPAAPGDDALGRGVYAEHAVGMLRRVRQQSDSGVLALIGPWGSGKSTVLGMITSLLTQPRSAVEPWLVAELNPWMYADLDSLTAGLFAEIRQSVPRDKRWRETRKQLAAFAQAVSPLGVLSMLAGVNSQPLLESLAKRVAGDTSVSAAKRQVENSLRQLNQPILVVMDDLDRLTPAELLLVFKLVRLVGRLPNVHYLLCYDERTLRDVLSRTELVGGQEARAGDFLEKMVQVRLDLPAFRERDANILIEQGLEEVLQDHGCSLAPEDVSRFQEAFFGHLQERLTTPRTIKRLFAQMDAGLGTVATEVDLVDFLLVTFLRTLEPGVFTMVKRYRSELTGAAVIWPVQQPLEQRQQVWRDRIARAGTAEEHREGLLKILAVLFPPISTALGRHDSARDAQKRRGVGSNDFFDRYTQFSITPDDLHEATVDAAMQQLASGSPGPEYTEFLERFRDDVHRVSRRLRDRADPLPAAELLALVADEIDTVSGPREGLGLLDAEASARSLAYDLFPHVAEGDRSTVLERMAATSHGAILAVQMLQQTIRRTPNAPLQELGTRQDLDPWAVESRARLIARLEAHAQPLAQQPAAQVAGLSRDLLVFWNCLAPESSRAWVRRNIAESHWILLDFLVALSRGYAIQDQRVVPDLDRFDAMVGLAFIRAELTADIAAAPDSPAPGAAASEVVLSALRRTAPPV